MIKFHDAFEDENNVYVVMEYVYILLRVNLSYKYDQIP
jgi:serine/threonine protein kinase